MKYVKDWVYKAICIDDREVEDKVATISALTIGKVYDVSIHSSYDMYLVIKDDRGIEGGYFKYRFKLMSEIRDEKLNELGL
jgi:hypothetical protein